MKRKFVAMGLIVVCVMLLSGCQTAGKQFGINGLPKEQYRVGGGFAIEYTAPQDGICYLVDQSSGRFLMTKQVAAEDTVTIDIPGDVDEEIRSSIIDLSKAKIVLYFVANPAQKEQ